MIGRPWRKVRVRLLVVVLVALAVALAVTTYGFNALFARASSSSANSLLKTRANSELSLLDLENGRLHVAETTDDTLGDSQLWIYDRRGLVEGPRTRSGSDTVARSLVGGPQRFKDVGGSHSRLLAVPVVIRGRREGTLVTGMSLKPYEQSARTALIESLALAAIMLGVVGGAVFWLLKSALRPVARMTEQAAAWSEHELDRRFGLGEPHDELGRLAATLDNLLDRISASLRRERRFSAELSHELRTPLARVIAEAELALRRDRDASEYRAALEVTLRNAHQVARIVETLVAAAQHEAGATRGTADAFAVAQKAVEGARELSTSRDLELVAERPQAPIRLGVDADLAERVLQPVVENACRYGRSRVRVELSRRGSRILYVVEDDGPGVAENERESIFEPGVRGQAGNGAVGAGLGLALARRLARTASGDVAVEPSTRGARFVVSLPAA